MLSPHDLRIGVKYFMFKCAHLQTYLIQIQRQVHALTCDNGYFYYIHLNLEILRHPPRRVTSNYAGANMLITQITTQLIGTHR